MINKNELTQEFKDFYFMTMNREDKIAGELPVEKLKEIELSCESKIKSFDKDFEKLGEYLKKCYDENTVEFQCMISVILNSNLDITDPTLKSILLNYKEYLKNLKEFNKPSN